MSTISEEEFIKLCEDIYADRLLVYSFNPNASRRDALHWMLAGCLLSLLSVAVPDEPSVYGGTSVDPYGDAVREILKDRMEPPFDPQPILRELSMRVEAEERGR
ncbi:MAG TPA: hypothetical protein VGX92_13475 [Pyrinomonadaceae bacterium]|jgi:hypothetical protein|nr:hypothetical protein [Pyrinomonadaceae bacterium]